MSDLFDSIPEISFIDNMTPEDLSNQLIQSFTEKYEEVTGKPITLKINDPTRLLLQALALPIYQSLQKIDNAGKMNLLKYAYGDYLDNLASFKNIKRQEAIPSTVNIKFTLSAIRSEDLIIPAGTNVTTGNYDVYWETDKDTIIPAGMLSVVVTMTCTEPGTLSNGYEVGTINELVNTIPYIDNVSNITVSANGQDVESDDRLRERVYLAPSAYSSAGSKSAYIYHSKTFNSAITDCVVINDKTQPGIVDIVFMTGN
ncbi:MAG: baseplate J/gp47 family protein, partial [Ruminococcus sp.]